MAVKLLFNELPQFVDANGDPYSGAKLFTYVAGSSTKQTTYQDSGAITANSNPIVCDSAGRVPYPIWGTTGVSYKLVLAPSTDTDPPTSPIFTIDNVTGINDTTVSIDQWVSGPTPTYVSATSFTLAGDQTSTFEVGRRVKTTNSGGTVYSTITASAYAALTTITVVNDSGSLDSGLSAVSYGLLSATNQSIPPLGMVIPLTSVSGTNTITASALTEATPLQTGQLYSFTPVNTNTGATTLNPNSIGSKNIFAGNSALVGGELKAGKPVVVMYDGTQFQIVGGTYKQPTRTVLTSGTGATYTTPTGATRINVLVKGGGNSGGSGANGSANGGGGGGGGGGEGGTAIKLIVGPSATYTYTVGGAGAASTFGTLTGNAGAAGSSGSTTPRAGIGGAGGTATGGDYNIQGAPGCSGGNGGGGNNINTGGLGGAGGGQGGGIGGSAATNGTNGANYGAGGGGGGGGDGAAGSGGSQGSGSSGVIVIDEYYD